MPNSGVFLDLAVALGLGLLVGLQRQRAGSAVAGIRTFPILTLAGSICALMPAPVNAWAVAAGLLAVVMLALIGNLTRRPEEESPGVTTESAMVLMFAVGALVVFGPLEVAVVVGATCAVLLHVKPVLHQFSARLGEGDVRAVMLFAVITLIILPVVPDRTFGPFGVFNPHHAWLMVVLVVGISLAAYVAYRWLGDRRGAIVAGLLGGLISSTATTASFSRRARAEPDSAPTGALAITLASTVLYARVLAMLFVVARESWATFAAPLVVMLGAGLACVVAALLRPHAGAAPIPTPENPTQLRSALFFALLFSVVIFASAAARHYFGDRGLYAVAALSGLTDLDAISLSTGRLVAHGQLTAEAGARAVVIALLANLAFKTGLAGVLGGRAIVRRVGPLMLAQFAAGLVALWWMWRGA